MSSHDWQQQGPPWPWWWSFYYWLGPISIPPLAAPLGMIDRADSVTTYYPSVTADGTHIVFSTTPPISANQPIRVYQPFDGPFVGQYGARMGIQGAHLVTEPYDMDAGPGPFVRCLTNNLLAAVFFMTASLAPSLFDHLVFSSAPVQGSIFDPTP